MQNKRWLSMLLSIVVAFGLWLYVVTVENPEDERTLSNIPVIFTGEDLLRQDNQLLITSDNVPTGISLTFSGKRSELIKLAENKSDLVVNVDVSKLRSAQDYTFSYDLTDIELPTTATDWDLTLVKGVPEHVTISVEVLDKKTIPVKVLKEVDIAEGYAADRLEQNYSEIVIEGPEDSVGRVSYAQAVLRRENVDQTITSTLNYQLMDEAGEIVQDPAITSNVTEIEVTLPVLLYKDVPLEVPLVEGGGAAAKDVVMDITPKTVRLSGDPVLLESIQSIKLPAVDLSALMTENETLTRIITIPEECTSLSGEQEAEVSIKIKNKATRQMRISSNHFQYIGASELQVIPRTNILNITVRANEEDINLILEDNVRVVADFSTLTLPDTTNSVTVPVKIYIDGFEGAGAIGESEYTIVVDISRTA